MPACSLHPGLQGLIVSDFLVLQRSQSGVLCNIGQQQARPTRAIKTTLNRPIVHRPSPQSSPPSYPPSTDCRVHFPSFLHPSPRLLSMLSLPWYLLSVLTVSFVYSDCPLHFLTFLFFLSYLSLLLLSVLIVSSIYRFS